MSLAERIHSHFQASAQTALAAAAELAPTLDLAAQNLVACLTQGGKVLACGLGGSASASQHFAALMLNRYEHERPGLAAMALVADSAVLSAIVDDGAADQVFSRQIRAFGQPGDVLLLFSLHGRTPAELRAVDAAHARGMSVVALSGKAGGVLPEQMHGEDVLICVPSESTARIHEIHLLIVHCLCDAVDSILLGVE
jgi:D-sedoheptulose 7-phosphate isomerase